MANTYISEDGVTTLISLTKNELKKKASSVNGVAPDAKGNVTLYGDKVALSSTDDTTITTKIGAVQSTANTAKDTSDKIKNAITSGDTALYTSTDASNPLSGTITRKFATSTELLGALCAQGGFFVGDKGYRVDNALFAQNEGVVNPDTGKTIVTLSPLFATKTELNDAIGGVTSIKAEVVTELPTTGVNGTIYLVAHAHGTGDAYDEYLWIESAKKFEKIGNTDIDLSSYAKKTDLDPYLTKELAASTYTTHTEFDSYLTNFAKKTDLDSYLTISAASTTYAKKTDLNSYLTTANASTTYAKKTDLNSYVAKADLTEITSTKVTELWNSIS